MLPGGIPIPLPGPVNPSPEDIDRHNLLSKGDLDDIFPGLPTPTFPIPDDIFTGPTFLTPDNITLDDILSGRAFEDLISGPTAPTSDDILPGPTNPSPEDIDHHDLFSEPTFPTFNDSLINVGTPPYNPFPDEGTTTVASEEEDDGDSSSPLSPTLQGLLDEAGKIIDDFVDSFPDWTVPENPADYYGPSPIHLSPGPTPSSPEDMIPSPTFLTPDVGNLKGIEVGNPKGIDVGNPIDSLTNVGTPPYNPFSDEGITSMASAGWATIAGTAGYFIGRKLDDLLGSNENGNDNHSDDLSDEYIELIGPAPDWMLDIF